MKRKMLVVTGVLLVAALAFAGQAVKVNALKGLTRVKIVCDVNVGDPKLLLKRMELLDKTWRQLAAAGMKPTVVMAFRGKASFFITKGEDYVAKEAQGAKREMRAWIERFKEAGFTIEQCALAAEMLDIEVKAFLPQVEVVENGYVSLIGYQQQEYALLPLD